VLKRLAISGALVAAVLVGAGRAEAGGGATVEVSPVSFTITSEQCPNLPTGTTIEGSGSLRSVTNERTSPDGVTTVINSSHATGTATDQDGNDYRFVYSNEFRASNTAGNPALFSGRMTDHFSVSGSGPARLSNGFVADFTANSTFTAFTFDPLHEHGDPISFPEGAAMCDPL
jgi:hypothetical protein